MTAALLALALAAPSAAAPSSTVTLVSRDAEGRPLDLAGLAARLARADQPRPDLSRLPLWAFPLDGGSPPARVRLSEEGGAVRASWPGGPARLEFVWPVEGDGYGGVSVDNGGHGYADGAVIELEEQLALTQYRLFKESWKRRISDRVPPFRPDGKAKRLYDDAREALASAARRKEAPARAAGFRASLRATSLAWQQLLHQAGRQAAARAPGSRFGLTLDESAVMRLDEREWVAEAVRRSGANWVRVVLRPNGADFAYASLRSFNEYDGVIGELLDEGVKVMVCVLDTAQWPRSLTPEAYAERVKNVVLHYKGRVSSWEVGSELNGDWLGGQADPLGLEEVYRIYAAGAGAVREHDPAAEVVATLYWWEQTAPDRDHSLSGWLERFAPRGFAKTADVVGVALYPEDNPVGMSFERPFDVVAAAAPGPKLMLSSYGYVEKDALEGYWWLDPADVDGARKDLVNLYTAAACAPASSVCGGFWWQTLDQMLPPGPRKGTDLFKVYVRALDQLGR